MNNITTNQVSPTSFGSEISGQGRKTKGGQSQDARTATDMRLLSLNYHDESAFTGEVEDPEEDGEDSGPLERMAIALLNELGVHESKVRHDTWGLLTFWAYLDQSSEEESIGASGEYPVRRYRHQVRVPDSAAAESFLADARVKRLGLENMGTRKLAETLDDCRIELEGDNEASALELTRVTSTLILATSAVYGRYERRIPVGHSDRLGGGKVLATNLAQWRKADQEAHAPTVREPLRKVSLRTECLRDSLVARAMMASYALDWRDADSPERLTGPDGTRRVGFDRDIEVTLADGTPGLDYLRWLLNQGRDMHVAAESLQRAELYDGERLPNDLIERMTPPADVRRNMAERLSNSCSVLEEVLADLRAAHQALVQGLPKPRAGRGHRSPRGRRA